ncbi:MAG: 2-amino-4-hydroxy-6-hydroxymethyldihydropteridine diphosphokinase [Chloroflexi bacterium]|nr:2-amino-4-hydroxy-6-hydroxymethyldihydropteridine diphosphokinase [Chloroflexota bacterium]
MPESYLGLGSNLGDRCENLHEALRRIGELPGTQLLEVSRVYETQPVGPVAQGWFLNAVVRVDTGQDPRALLQSAKAIERTMGRLAGERWGPRVIDVDVLLYGGVSVREEGLSIPHPELWDRRFVLVPLFDVLPEGELRDQVRRRIEELGDVPEVRPFGTGLWL